MAIDPKKEKLITMQQAARLPWLPARRGGKTPTVQTFLRWAIDGIGGVKLDSCRFGETLCTSEDAVIRFVAATSGETSESDQGKRAKNFRSAAEFLHSAGI